MDEENDEEHIDVDEIRYIQIKTQVDNVKDIVANNISLIIDRENNIDNIVRDTEELAESSTTFRNSVKKLKCKIFKKNWCYSIMLFLFICLILLLLTFIFCGFSFNFKHYKVL